MILGEDPKHVSQLNVIEFSYHMEVRTLNARRMFREQCSNYYDVVLWGKARIVRTPSSPTLTYHRHLETGSKTQEARNEASLGP